MRALEGCENVTRQDVVEWITADNIEEELSIEEMTESCRKPEKSITTTKCIFFYFLSQIGIKDVFDIDKANLLEMFDQYLYLSRIIQKSEIEVDEEGTVATAAVGASLENKSRPPRFQANRPFLYFIVDKPTTSIVFCGKISNPNTLK
nr:serine protease inhibitor 77Ba-like [Leptinotarsa decemlineata]